MAEWEKERPHEKVETTCAEPKLSGVWNASSMRQPTTRRGKTITKNDSTLKLSAIEYAAVQNFPWSITQFHTSTAS